MSLCWALLRRALAALPPDVPMGSALGSSLDSPLPGSAASVAGGSPVLALNAENRLSLPTQAVAAQPQSEAQLNSGAEPSGTGGGEAAQTWHVNKSGIQKCPNSRHRLKIATESIVRM